MTEDLEKQNNQDLVIFPDCLLTWLRSNKYIDQTMLEQIKSTADNYAQGKLTIFQKEKIKIRKRTVAEIVRTYILFIQNVNDNKPFLPQARAEKMIKFTTEDFDKD